MDGIFICHVLGWKLEKKVFYAEPYVSKISHENMILRVFTQKHNIFKLHPWMKKLNTWIRFSSIKIIHEWKNPILGWKCHPWEKHWMIFSSVDDIQGWKIWMKMTDVTHGHSLPLCYRVLLRIFLAIFQKIKEK